MPTEMELTLEQTQQGGSYEVSICIEALHTLRQKPGQYICCQKHLERFNTTAGNPVKKILLKLNLSDHRLFKDGGGDIDGNVHTFKAHLVAKGYTQTYGVDYGETFSPVANIRAIRILLAVAAFYDYEIWQMEVKTAFLNSHLSEDVYMVQPGWFVDLKHPNKVCKLQRSIYGLKQASRSWNKRFDVEIKKIGFTQNHDEPCVYLKASGSSVAFLIFQALVLSSSKSLDTVYASRMIRCIDVRILLVYGAKPEAEPKASCYADASFQTDKDDTKSQTGYVFVLNGGAIDWKSDNQSTTAMSSIESEYISAAEASMESV
ncbi:retrotransposon protein, putative, ty1-copia subclass [Tanacetum coccineum]